MARKQYPLRIDPAVWDAVCRWADDDFRSVNAQVEWIIRDALKRAGRLPRPGDDARDPGASEGASGFETATAADAAPEE